MTDTAGASDLVFGLFWLLGYQFSPRLADAGASVFWRMDNDADYGVLNDIARGQSDHRKIVLQWDEMIRAAGSLKLGKMQASVLIRSLLKSERPSGLTQAIIEVGRINKTLYLLNYIDDEDYRRRILTQLNRGESRHAVARAICQKMPTSIPCWRAQRSMAWVAQRNRSLSSGLLLLKNGHSCCRLWTCSSGRRNGPGYNPMGHKLVASIGNAHDFKNGRQSQLAAWLGLTPSQYSSGGKSKPGRITKAGDSYLRTLLVQGARSVLIGADKKTDSFSRWVCTLVERRGYWRAVVAIAAKNARLCWASLHYGDDFRLYSAS